MATVAYFAYGSNLSLARITREDRAPSAVPLRIAWLPGHTLRFHKRGRHDGTGKCNAFPTGKAEDVVYGVVYRIATDDRTRLDRAEGVGEGYRRAPVRLVSEAGKVEAYTYLADAAAIDETLSPRRWYLDLVIGGAREHRLPQWYVDRLTQVVAD